MSLLICLLLRLRLPIWRLGPNIFPLETTRGEMELRFEISVHRRSLSELECLRPACPRAKKVEKWLVAMATMMAVIMMTTMMTTMMTMMTTMMTMMMVTMTMTTMMTMMTMMPMTMMLIKLMTMLMVMTMMMLMPTCYYHYCYHCHHHGN